MRFWAQRYSRDRVGAGRIDVVSLRVEKVEIEIGKTIGWVCGVSSPCGLDLGYMEVMEGFGQI
jgi:hypothetical protein